MILHVGYAFVYVFIFVMKNEGISNIYLIIRDICSQAISTLLLLE